MSVRKVVRTSAVLVAAALAVPLWAVPSASAETSTEPAAIGAYFYSLGVDKPEASPAPPPNVTGDNADGVGPQHLAVAVSVPGEVDKASFLSFDLATVPFDATITKAVVTVPLAENGGDNVVLSPAAAKVRACAAGDTGFNGEDGASFANAPEQLCDVFAAPAQDSADLTAYTFDVSALAATWLTDLNSGIALTVADGATSSPFQVVFLPFAESSIALEYTVPPDEIEVIEPDASLDTGTSDTPDFGLDDTSFGGGSFDGGSLDGGSTDGGSTDLGGFGSVESPVVDSGTTADVLDIPAPVAAGPAGTVPVASIVPSEVLAPSGTFWLAAALFAGLLALLSLIMGDARVPARSTSQTRLGKALQARERGAALSPLGI